MNVLGAVCVFLVLWLGFTAPARGQISDSDKRHFELVKAQAERGDAQAQLTLGSLYASGTGVNRDLSKAAKWHRKAAEQGLARAQLRVAYEYAGGIGVKVDPPEALRWLRRAADQGLADAQCELGNFYSTGQGTAENSVEAAKWYRKAAEQGFAQAEHSLGKCFFEGLGVTKDIAEGVEWTRKTAEQALADAENSLGMCYAKGNGVTQNYLEAYKWFNLAVAQGSEQNVDARMNLSMAERALTPEQIAVGQKLARAFRPHAAGQQSGTPSLHAQPGSAAPAAGASPAGFLNVKADDDTCEVFLDGTFVGNTPARLKLDPATHVIVVKKPGFKEFRREIKVPEGSDLTLRAVLERQ